MVNERWRKCAVALTSSYTSLSVPSIRSHQRHERQPYGPVTGGGTAGTAINRQREDHKDPYPRVKGGYCGHGLGSLVTCRHLLAVSWRLLAVSGLDIPVPGVGSRVVMPSENTAQRTAGCRTCHHKHLTLIY